MVKLNIDVPSDFYNEETRCGFHVTRKVKELWAIEIDLLKKFEQVCEKYNLKYSLAFGSMLGAVRHKGFIAWDDDMDVVMMRDDYDKLLQHADEFQHPYFLQTPASDKECFINVVKLRNSETTGFVKYDRYRPFNNGVFIDIFVLDTVPLNLAARCWKRTRSIFTGGIVYGLFYLHEFIEYISGRHFKMKFVPAKRKLFRKFEKICSEKAECEEVRTYQFFAEQYNVFKKTDMDDIITVPLEWTTAKMIKNYHTSLSNTYGPNYMTPKHVPASHDGLIYDTDTPYHIFLARYNKGNR